MAITTKQTKRLAKRIGVNVTATSDVLTNNVQKRLKMLTGRGAVTTLAGLNAKQTAKVNSAVGGLIS